MQYTIAAFLAVRKERSRIVILISNSSFDGNESEGYDTPGNIHVSQPILRNWLIKRRLKELLYQLSYRIPLYVTETRTYSSKRGQLAYPVCPRCGRSIEREYQSYCDRCGQCLRWDAYE